MSENMFAAAEDIPQLIHQLVGAGSTCWIGGTGDSEFWTAQAMKVAQDAITRLNELGCRSVLMTDSLRDRVLRALFAAGVEVSHIGRVADTLIATLPELQPCPFCHLTHNECDCLRNTNA